MTTEVLNQLRALRESIAETLRKDPRYLTLAALDKSITEIGSVLTSAGIDVAPATTAQAPMQFEAAAASAPSVAPTAPAPTAPPTPPPVTAPAGAPPHLAAAAPAAVASSAVAPAPDKKKKKKKSILKPAAAVAGALVAGGIAAEMIHAAHADAPAKHGSKRPESDHDQGDGEASPASEDEPKDQPEADEATDKAETEHAGDESTGDESHGDKNDSIIPKGKASGYTPMAAKPGAAQYQPGISVKFGKLPNKVDLRPLMTPIEDQGETSSCVANAVAGAYEYWIKKASKQDQNISRLFVYYNARWRDGSQDKDDGSVIQLAMEGLSKFGACNEKVWPFDTHLVTKKPGADAYQDAAPFKVHDMAQVPLKLESWKQALAEGKPIVFGVLLFDSFDECSKKGGVVPMPAPDDLARKTHSGHSMCAVGYSDSEKVFIVRNSWGADWGDKGYCYMPYAYLMSDKLNDGDCWIFVPKVPSQPPREVWSDDSTPVTNSGEGVDFPIEPYTTDDYQKVAVNLFESIRKPFNTTLLADYSKYVSLASSAAWSEMESFDFRTFLASAAVLAGGATAVSAFSSSEASASESLESSESSESLEESEESKEESEGSESDSEEDSEDSEDTSDDEDESDEDESDDDESDDDDASDDAADGDESDDDADDDSAGDDDESDEDSDDADSDEDGSDDDDSEDDDSEDDDSDEDDDSEDEDSDDEDDSDDDSSEGDGGGDEGGGDDGDD